MLNERTSERARENRGRRRIYIVQIYSRLDFGSLPILFSRAKVGSHCARANFVTDYRAVLVGVGGDDSSGGSARPLLHADSLRSFVRFRSRCWGNTREKVAQHPSAAVSILLHDPQSRARYMFDIFPINCRHPWPIGKSFADINSTRKSSVKCIPYRARILDILRYFFRESRGRGKFSFCMLVKKRFLFWQFRKTSRNLLRAFKRNKIYREWFRSTAKDNSETRSKKVYYK